MQEELLPRGFGRGELFKFLLSPPSPSGEGFKS